MTTQEVARLWAVEWDMAGAVDFHPLMEVLHRNWKIATGRELPGLRIIVGLFPTMESAQEGARELKREIRELRMRDAEVGTGKVTP